MQIVSVQGSLIRIYGFVVPLMYFKVTSISGKPSDEISPIKILPGLNFSSSEYISAALVSRVITYLTTFLSSTL